MQFVDVHVLWPTLLRQPSKTERPPFPASIQAPGETSQHLQNKQANRMKRNRNFHGNWGKLKSHIALYGVAHEDTLSSIIIQFPYALQSELAFFPFSSFPFSAIKYTPLLSRWLPVYQIKKKWVRWNTENLFTYSASRMARLAKPLTNKMDIYSTINCSIFLRLIEGVSRPTAIDIWMAISYARQSNLLFREATALRLDLNELGFLAPVKQVGTVWKPFV